MRIFISPCTFIQVGKFFNILINAYVLYIWGCQRNWHGEYFLAEKRTKKIYKNDSFRQRSRIEAANNFLPYWHNYLFFRLHVIEFRYMNTRVRRFVRSSFSWRSIIFEPVLKELCRGQLIHFRHFVFQGKKEGSLCSALNHIRHLGIISLIWRT